MLPTIKKKDRPVTTAQPTHLHHQAIGWFQATSMVPATYRIKDSQLIVPPFKLEKYGQIYNNPVELIVDIRSLRPGQYRIVAVQNFHVEDSNPNLNECLGGVFLAAKRADGTWEEPETFPCECCTLKILGHVHVKP